MWTVFESGYDGDEEYYEVFLHFRKRKNAEIRVEELKTIYPDDEFRIVPFVAEDDEERIIDYRSFSPEYGKNFV